MLTLTNKLPGNEYISVTSAIYWRFLAIGVYSCLATREATYFTMLVAMQAALVT